MKTEVLYKVLINGALINAMYAVNTLNGAVIYMNKKYFKFKISYVFVCRIEPRCGFIHVPAFRN